MSVDDNRAHHLSQMVFLKKVLISDHRGLSIQKGCFLPFCPFLQNGSKDPPNFLHKCIGQLAPSVEIDGFFEKVLNPGL